MHVGLYGHNAVDDRLVRRRADGDLQGLKRQGAVLGARVVQEVADGAARSDEQVGIVDGRRGGCCLGA